MPIVKKTIPYEILIRFGFGGGHQSVKPGEYSGAQYQEATIVYDDETGEAFGAPVIGDPQDVPQEKLIGLLGDKFAAVVAGVNAMTAAAMARVAAAESDRDAAVKSARDERDAAVKAEQEAAAGAATQIASLTAQLAAAHQALRQYDDLASAAASLIHA
jgi:hypothetical protein